MTVNWRKWLGWKLRCFADRVDREHAFLAYSGILIKSLSKPGYEVYHTEGVCFPKPVPGAQLYYRNDEYDQIWAMYDDMKDRGLIK